MSKLQYQLKNGVTVTLNAPGPDDLSPFMLSGADAYAQQCVYFDMTTTPGLEGHILPPHAASARTLAGLMNTFEFGRKWSPKLITGIDVLEEIKATPAPAPTPNQLPNKNPQ